MTVEINRFNLRVYGVLVNTNRSVLLVDEQIGDYTFTKFPGGGLEFGEGIVDCLKREFREELGQEPISYKHLYTTEFFQQSAFRYTDQIVSIYYWVDALQEDFSLPMGWQERNTGKRVELLSFKWVSLDKLHPDMVTFPIDKHVVELVLKQKADLL